MGEVGIRIIFLFIDVVLPMAAGYACRQKRWLDEKQCNILIHVNITIITTLLTTLTFWVLPIKPHLMLLPVFMVLNAFIPVGVIFLFHRQRKFTSMADQGSYILAALLTNLGTLGGLCGYILYGERGFAYAQLTAVFQNFITFFIAFPLGAYYKYSAEAGGHLSPVSLNWRKVFINWNQMPVVGMALGIALCALGIPRPQILDYAFQGLIHIGAWSGLVPIGFMIEFSAFPRYYKKTFDLVPIKLLVTPAICYVLSRFCFTDPVLIGTLMILMSMPTAIFSLFAVRLYNLNVNLAMSAFITTTAFYIFLFYPMFYFLVHLGYLTFT